jgi:methyl-accepting chemotaxis protein
VPTVRIQSLFLVVVILKVSSSALGWWWQMPWSLGLIVPLSIMAIYIATGIFRRDREVTDEKFADSCYYLGFIFTVTSIIFSLFDLPSIGTRIQDIAVRFGAAMISTVFGLAVRVYLVSFKRDAADSLKDVEEEVIEASARLREHLMMSVERLAHFQSQVDSAAQASVERVNLQVEKLSKDHAEKLTEFFGTLIKGNQDAFTKAMTGVTVSTLRLSQSVDAYTNGMNSNLTSIEKKVTSFGEAVTARLAQTSFPDDYFAKHLERPVALLEESASAVAENVRSSAVEIASSTKALATAMKRLQTKAAQTDGVLDAIGQLTKQQQAVVDAAENQSARLNQLGQTLGGFDTSLRAATAALEGSNFNMHAVAVEARKTLSQISDDRSQLHASLSQLATKFSEAFARFDGLQQSLVKTAAASDGIAAGLENQTSATADLVSTLQHARERELEAAAKVADFLDRARAVLGDSHSVLAEIAKLGDRLASFQMALDIQKTDIHALKYSAATSARLDGTTSEAASGPTAFPPSTAVTPIAPTATQLPPVN